LKKIKKIKNIVISWEGGLVGPVTMNVALGPRSPKLNNDMVYYHMRVCLCESGSIMGGAVDVGSRDRVPGLKRIGQ
jgi:hypothetical protein